MSSFRKNFLRNGLNFKTLPVTIKPINYAKPSLFSGKRKLKKNIYIYRERERQTETDRERELSNRKRFPC